MKDLNEFAEIIKSEEMQRTIAKASTEALKGCVSSDGKHIENMQMYVVNASTAISFAMIQEYHRWVNS